MKQIKTKEVKIKIINGPNLNLLGQREQKIYGSVNFEHYLNYLNKKYKQCSIEYFQSNHEGEIIDFLHDNNKKNISIVLNAGAYTHYSYAIRDAISAINSIVIEVHISNIYKREEFRHRSVISEVCSGTIVGFGLTSYELAVQSILLSEKPI